MRVGPLFVTGHFINSREFGLCGVMSKFWCQNNTNHIYLERVYSVRMPLMCIENQITRQEDLVWRLPSDKLKGREAQSSPILIALCVFVMYTLSI